MSATKELQSIVAARASGHPAALVTVVKTQGSSYRKPGARMLVDAAGHSVGSISGGCLEDDAREHAAAAIASGQPTLVRYDTTSDGDIVFGSGLGCQGIVHILIEPLPSPGAATDPLNHVARALAVRRCGVLATVFSVDESAPTLPLGSFLWLDESADLPTGPLTDSPLAAAVTRDAAETQRRGRPTTRVYPLANGGHAEVFLDVIRPARSLLICGAGDDARPLASLGAALGWRVRVVDGRRAYATRERFPDADEVTTCPSGDFRARVPVEPGESVVLMTHNYLHDRNLLGALLDSPAGYLGVLGPRRRTERLLAELARTTKTPGRGAFGPRSLARVHGPAGLDIGAEAPEQIALAILAEIEAVSAGRRGGALRKRRAPLHEGPPRDMELAA